MITPMNNLLRMMKKKESEFAYELSIHKRKISKLESDINDIKKESDRKLKEAIDEYEKLLETKRKLHEADLRMARGLSGTKLRSDDHHRGNKHVFFM